MKVSEIGEFKLINLIAGLVQELNVTAIKPDKQLLIGIGDDSAAWKSRGKIQLSTTDCLIQDVHFSFNYINWRDLGYKSIAINLSDIAAMGGTPQYAFVSLAMPLYTEVENIRLLYQGMIDMANKYGTRILGGNISSADKLVINITVHGYSETTRLLTRSAARDGDKIAVTGFTGLSAAGLLMLKNNLSVDSASYELLSQAHLRPEPRITEGKLLLKNGVNAAIDISDGLLADLGHICEASHVSAIVRQDSIAVNPTLRDIFKEDFMKLVLTGGEDYELLFTARPDTVQKLQDIHSFSITVIGEIVKIQDNAVIVRDSSGQNVTFSSEGWDHFK